MKKINKFFALQALTIGLSLFFTSCNPTVDVGTNNNEVSSKPGKVLQTEFTEGTIIRNKIVMFNSTDVLYEYLNFTSAEGGEYFIYSSTDEQNFQAVTNLEGIAVPTTFTYNKEDCSFKTNFNGKDITSYMFKTEEATPKFYIASELLNSTKEVPVLFDTWTHSNGDEYSFSKDGVVVIKNNDKKYSYNYTNTNGLIKIDELQLFWADFSGKAKFYYSAYETESTPVEQVGRALRIASEYNFTSAKSILGIF